MIIVSTTHWYQDEQSANQWEAVVHPAQSETHEHDFSCSFGNPTCPAFGGSRLQVFFDRLCRRACGAEAPVHALQTEPCVRPRHHGRRVRLARTGEAVHDHWHADGTGYLWDDAGHWAWHGPQVDTSDLTDLGDA